MLASRGGKRAQKAKESPPVVIWGLECCRLLALGLGWLEALPWRPPTLPAQFSRSAFGFGNPVPFES